MVFYNGYQSYRRKKIKDHVVARVDVNGLITFMNISYDPNNWRLFTDSSELNLKTTLLHKDNLLPSILIKHFVHMKETYVNVKLILELIKYKDNE